MLGIIQRILCNKLRIVSFFSSCSIPLLIRRILVLFYIDVANFVFLNITKILDCIKIIIYNVHML